MHFFIIDSENVENVLKVTFEEMSCEMRLAKFRIASRKIRKTGCDSWHLFKVSLELLASWLEGSFCCRLLCGPILLFLEGL